MDTHETVVNDEDLVVDARFEPRRRSIWGLLTRRVGAAVSPEVAQEQVERPVVDSVREHDCGMDLILHNPFRILGLPVAATARETAKSISELSTFAEMDKERTLFCDNFFPIEPRRTPTSIQDAARSIERPESKLFHALFWFWNDPTSTIDEMAFEELKHGHHDKAIYFWKKAIDTGTRAPNASNYKNLSILYLGLASKSGGLDGGMFLEALSLFGRFLAHDHFDRFVKHVIGDKYSSECHGVVSSSVDEIISWVGPHLGDGSGLEIKDMIGAFTAYPAPIRNSIRNKFIGRYIHNIERQIGDAMARCDRDLSDASRAGFELFDNTKRDLDCLRRALSASDLEYQTIADKLATQIINCSICYFNEFRDSDTDPGDDALKLAQCARHVAIGRSVLQRIDEGMPILKEYVEEKPKRAKLKPVHKEVESIFGRLNDVQGTEKVTEYPRMAREFLLECKAQLQSIKDHLGATDQDYLELSDLVAGRAIGMCVLYLDSVAKVAARRSDLQKRGIFVIALEEVKHVCQLVDSYDMSDSARTKYDEFRSAIGLKRSSSSGSGCYIATMIYGLDSAPEVMVLRAFRDEVLLRSRLGRRFVQAYYGCSPWVVRKTKHARRVHTVLRFILDHFVRYLKAKR